MGAFLSLSAAWRDAPHNIYPYNSCLKVLWSWGAATGVYLSPSLYTLCTLMSHLSNRNFIFYVSHRSLIQSQNICLGGLPSSCKIPVTAAATSSRRASVKRLTKRNISSHHVSSELFQYLSKYTKLIIIKEITFFMACPIKLWMSKWVFNRKKVHLPWTKTKLRIKGEITLMTPGLLYRRSSLIS